MFYYFAHTALQVTLIAEGIINVVQWHVMSVSLFITKISDFT